MITTESGLMKGIIWDDSTDDGATPAGAPDIHDGIRRSGYKGIADEDVELYAYAWTGKPDNGGAGWWPLTTDATTGSLKFEDERSFNVSDPAASATPSNAKPVAKTRTSPAGEWQFKLEPQVHLGQEPNTTYYLVGYRVRVPSLKKGYTYTTIHSNWDTVDTSIDSDLAGDSWMHRRSDAEMDGTLTGTGSRSVNWNPEKNSFDRTDPFESSIYMPYQKVTDPDHTYMNLIELADGVKYDYGRINSIGGVDAGLVPYAKGSVSGIVWNDIQKENGKLKYDGIREDDKEPRIPDVPVILQYQRINGEYTFVYEYDQASLIIVRIQR